jgi:hypothetical protein
MVISFHRLNYLFFITLSYNGIEKFLKLKKLEKYFIVMFMHYILIDNTLSIFLIFFFFLIRICVCYDYIN